MYVYIGIGIIISIIFLFLYWRFFFFFRNPKRAIPYDTKSILSPADGFVIYSKKINPGDDIFSIKKNKHIKLDDLMFIDDKDLKNQPGWLIGVFMTFLDVHYNRAPIGGHIKKIRHDFPNKFNINKRLFKLYLNILFFRKPLWKNCNHIFSNERASYVIKNKNLSVYVTQIADSWVNKIVTFKDNEKIKQGEIFGLVKMGSQVDIFVPDKNKTFDVVIKVRQRVKAGLTELIRIKD